VGDETTKPEEAIEKVVKRVSAWKVLVSIAAGLLVAGGSTALYFTRYAKKTEVKAVMDAHAAAPIHVDMAARMIVVEQAGQNSVQRLVRVETTTEDIKAQQNRIEDKLDYLIMQKPGMRVNAGRLGGGEPPPAPRDPTLDVIP
jgi:molybdopterin-binding protein